MAGHRKPPKPDFKNAEAGTCIICKETIYRGGEKTGEIIGKGTWHNDCAHEYKIVHWPGYARDVVFKRDQGKCANCDSGKIPALRRELLDRLRAKFYPAGKLWYEDRAAFNEQLKVYKHWLSFLDKRYPPALFGWVPAWDLDHRIPLIEGGSFGLENMQTLCRPCHKAKTAIEAKQRAEKRKSQERSNDANLKLF